MNTTEHATNELPAGKSVVGPREEDLGNIEHQTLIETFSAMMHELVEYRELLWQLTLRDIRIRYKQAIMGFGWAILMPMLIVGAGLIIKYAMARMSGNELGIENFAGVAVKALPWAFFVGSIGFATTSLTSNIRLITKIYFPREVFPISAVLAQSLDTLVASTVVAALIFGFLWIGASLQVVWALPIGLLIFLFTSGMALFLSCANLFFRDVKYIVHVLLTFGIFFTPVFYEPANLGVTGSRLIMLNPLAPLLEGIRLAVVEHHNLLNTLVVAVPGGQDVLAWHPVYLLYSGCFALLLAAGAWFMFHKLEFVFAEYI